MIGKPNYKIGDIVQSYIIDDNDEKRYFTGTIEVVDAYGTFGQSDYVSYDIMVDDWFDSGQPMFCKHFIEPNVTLVKEK